MEQLGKYDILVEDCRLAQEAFSDANGNLDKEVQRIAAVFLQRIAAVFLDKEVQRIAAVFLDKEVQRIAVVFLPAVDASDSAAAIPHPSTLNPKPWTLMILRPSPMSPRVCSVRVNPRCLVCVCVNPRP